MIKGGLTWIALFRMRRSKANREHSCTAHLNKLTDRMLTFFFIIFSFYLGGILLDFFLLREICRENVSSLASGVSRKAMGSGGRLGFRACPPCTQLSAVALVLQGWAWLPVLGVATWSMVWQHCLRLGCLPPITTGGVDRPNLTEWCCNSVCQDIPPSFKFCPMSSLSWHRSRQAIQSQCPEWEAGPSPEGQEATGILFFPHFIGCLFYFMLLHICEKTLGSIYLLTYYPWKFCIFWCTPAHRKRDGN